MLNRMRRALISARHLGGYLLVVLVTWLVQVTAVPYIRISFLPTVNLCFCTTAVITVCYGKTRAYWTGTIYGILYETMLPTIPMLNLLFYPLSALVASVFFADRSEQRLTELRASNPNIRNDKPFLRTVGCAGLITLFYEIVNISYIYLGRATLTVSHFSQALLNIVLTMLLTWPIALLERKFLGFPRGAEPAVQPGYYAS